MGSPTTRLLLLCLLCALPAAAAQVQVSVTGPNDAPLKNALVIVQDLQQHPGHELFRALTDEQGSIPAHSLSPGLYRAIATFPYSHLRTSVREFLVANDPINVQLHLTAAESTDSTTVSIGQLTVHVLDAAGHPAVGARVLVRDADARPDSEQSGATNAQGTTTLTLTVTPDVLVVVYRDKLYTFPAEAFSTAQTVRLR